MLRKQAKILSDKQQKLVLNYIEHMRNPVRNRLIFLLSVKAGLRAKEIANLTWSMITDSQGNILDRIELQDVASKGCSGRVIYINKDLLDSLSEWKKIQEETKASKYIISSERSYQTSSPAIVNFFARLFRDLNLEGASSHSGRRTFITNAAKKITSVGGSLRDVQILAGHSSLNTTQRYIEHDNNAMRKIVDIV